MKDEKYMQVYCAALTGLIAAQGRNDLLSIDYKGRVYPEDQSNKEWVQMKLQFNEQIDLIGDLSAIAARFAKDIEIYFPMGD